MRFSALFAPSCDPAALRRLLLLFAVSFVVVAFGQPAWSPFLGMGAALCGYALIWKAGEALTPAPRFALTAIWFFCVQLVQLSWMTSYEYTGPYILLVYVLLSLAIGLQFAIVSAAIPAQLTLLRIGTVASLWIFMEWSRLFFICGFTFNPVGLAWACSDASSQLLALTGIFGLSFLTIAANLAVLRWWRQPSLRSGAVALSLAALPFVFGWAHIRYHEARMDKAPSLGVVLVQTALLPDQKLPYPGDKQRRFLSPLEQWSRIWRMVAPLKGKEVGLIVLPEAVVPYGTTLPVAAYEDSVVAFTQAFGSWSKSVLPPPAAPLVQEVTVPPQQQTVAAVTNGYFAQALANLFDAEVVLGLEDFENLHDAKEMVSYQAAFHFLPYDYGLRRYEKQILVPMAEYLPFDWCRSYSESQGIFYFYSHGKGGKIFPQGKRPLGLAICYEETFGDLMRENRLMGAELLINVSNDVWYPNSKLPRQHCSLGRLRTIENGVPLVRACNTGVTCAFDSLGRLVAEIPDSGESPAGTPDAIYCRLPTYHYETLYSRTGDALVLVLCCLFLCGATLSWLWEKGLAKKARHT